MLRLDAIEKGEWEAVKPAKTELSRYAQIAKATLKKDQRMNIRVSKAAIPKGRLQLAQGETVSWEDVKKKADRQKSKKNGTPGTNGTRPKDWRAST